MSDNRCISCGDIIPEGRQICLKCERFTNDDEIEYIDDYENDLKYFLENDKPESKITLGEESAQNKDKYKKKTGKKLKIKK